MTQPDEKIQKKIDCSKIPTVVIFCSESWEDHISPS